MSIRISGDGASGTLLKLVMTAMVLLAVLACGEAAQGPEPTSAPPPGMFSQLPTNESPILGDQAARHRAEHAGANAHATTDSHTQSYLYARANADATAYGHPYAQPDRHPRADGHAQPYTHAKSNSHASTNPHSAANIYACAAAHLQAYTKKHSQPQGDHQTKHLALEWFGGNMRCG